MLKSFKKRKNVKEIVEDTFGEDPLGINDLPFKTQPNYMRGKGGIWYWTGGLTTVAFFFQIITGLIILMYYNPADAYNSTEYFLTSVPYGALLLTTHLYGAYAMLVLLYIHMYRNYFTGAYKKPRQIQWILGVLLLALTVGTGFFGYNLTGDVLSNNATDVGKGIALLTPFFGKTLVQIGFGDGTATGQFIRLLGWHVIMTALIGAIFALHFFLAENHNFKPAGYKTNYKAPALVDDYHEHKPWYPYNMVFLIQLSIITIGLIVLIPSIIALIPNVPALFSPFPQVSPSSPLAPYVTLYPPWFLLFLYKAMDFNIYGNITVLNANAPLITSALFGIIPLLYFIVIPFLDRGNELHPLARPKTTAFGILGIVYMIILSAWGALTPGVPIPGIEVLMVLAPPFVIVMAGMLVLGKLYKSGRLKISADKLIVSTLAFIMILIGAVMALSYNFAAFLGNSSGMNLIATLFSGGVTAFAAFGTVKAADYSLRAPDKTRMGPTLSKNSAVVLSAVLTVISIIIMVLVIQINPLPYTNSFIFGIGLGIDLIIAGVIIRLYRLVAYDE